jgi:xanthine dehydrogenase YagS FAD-binding subunit
LLIGKPASIEHFRAVADAVLRHAQPLEHNGFKIELARRAIIRALGDAAAGGQA